MLASLGLNATQIRVLEALHRTGETGSQHLIKESGVASANLYPALDSLIEMGLVTSIPVGKHKKYASAGTRALLSLYEQKKEELLQVEPQLTQYLASLSSALPSELPFIQLFENIAGVKSAVQKAIDTLTEGETYYVLGAPMLVNRSLNGFFREIHELRLRKKIQFKILYCPDNILSKERTKLALTSVRYLTQTVSVECAIYHNTVQFVFLGEHPRVVEITHPDFAKTMRVYFEMLWMSAKL